MRTLDRQARWSASRNDSSESSLFERIGPPHLSTRFAPTPSSSIPFNVALNARLSPSEYLVAAQGQANGIRFRTAAPARIRQDQGAWRLSPTRIDFGRGSVLMAGSYGNGLNVQARLDQLQLSILDAFVPNLGISGQASGALDFAQARDASFPSAEARLTIANFRRTGLSAVSEAVDVVFAGRLVPDGGEARALIRRGQTVVGRMVASLRPLPPGTPCERGTSTRPRGSPASTTSPF